jgi:hypothetical protein
MEGTSVTKLLAKREPTRKKRFGTTKRMVRYIGQVNRSHSTTCEEQGGKEERRKKESD